MMRPAALGAQWLVFGSAFLGIRVAIETIPPLVTAALRFLAAGLVLYAWARARGAARPSAAQWRAAAAAGAFLFFVGNGAIVLAQRRVPSGLAAVLVASVPVWMVVIDWLAFGARRPGWRVWTGLALGLAGLGVLVGPAALFGAGRVAVGPALVLVGAAVAWATGSLLARRATLPDSLLLSAGMQLLAGGALLVAAAGALGMWAQFHPAAVSTRSWLALGWLALVCSVGGYTLYVWLLQRASAALASTYAFVAPIVAVLLGWALADEPLTARAIAATAVIVAAVALLVLAPRGEPAATR